MKILLIVPAHEKYRVSREHPEVADRAMLRFSVLGLTTVAALTPPEHEVLLCDENVEPLDLDADVDVVGVTFMTGLARRAFEIAREFRRRGKITVAGGMYPTLCPEEAGRHFDVVVRGEAEDVWHEVLSDIYRGTPRRLYDGRGGGALRSPIARRDLLARNARHYGTLHAVQAGRGCRHACRFCSIAAFSGSTYRHRAVADIVAELRDLPGDFMFVDDNIVAEPDFAKELFRALIPLGRRWISQCSIKVADDPELLSLAARAGCRGLFIGIESTSADQLAAMGKDFNDPQGYRRRIRAIHDAGIGVQAGIIVGMDGDDVTVFERTLEFLQEARIDALQLAILTPQPGTPLFQDFDKAGRITDKDWSRFDFRHTVIRPARMSARDLQDGADWLYSQFYRLDRVLLRVLRVACTVGLFQAALTWKLNRTYRYDNLREGIVGRNPAEDPDPMPGLRGAVAAPAA